MQLVVVALACMQVKDNNAFWADIQSSMGIAIYAVSIRQL